MPIYEFACRDCEHRFDQLVSLSEEGDMTCPECTSTDVAKLFSPFAIHSGSRDVVQVGGGGACLPGPAGESSGGGCCGGGCGCCG